MPMHDGPGKYFDWLEARLKEAGIPVEGDNLLHGTLHRFDDPNDFGSIVYRWEPNAVLTGAGQEATGNGAPYHGVRLKT